MKKSKWPDFLFAIGVRFFCGVILGALACLLFSWRGILQAFAHNNTHGPLMWLAVCGLGGGIVAVFTVPRWKTPWYRRDSEALDIWAGIQSQLEAVEKEAAQEIGKESGVAETSLTGDVITSKIVRHENVCVYKIADASGVERVYHSLEEMPPEVRAAMTAAEQKLKG